MAEYNAKLHVKTSTGYDDINLQTKSEIVEFDKAGTDLTSTNASDAIKEINSKVNNNFVKKTDVINNLVSTNTDKPLSANMGKALDDKVTQLNSALNVHRTYCFDSGWTSYFALSVPTGTNAVVFLDTAIYRVESMTNQINVNKIATGSADNSTVVRYLEERYVAFRQNDSQGTIRAIVLTSFADVVPRW